MPPKPKITRDIVIDTTFEVARKSGAENINARTVSKKLNRSTQPVMYHFITTHLVRVCTGAILAIQEEMK